MSVVLAFSGGLDTSFCVPFLKETLQESVITVTVDTGGLSKGEAAQLEEKALALGASHHYTIDGREHLYDHVLSYLIKGNVLKGDVYPLCVGPERVTQAIKIAEIASLLGASAIAHGSTGAGNDQIRFDVALQLLAPGVEIIAPIRDYGLSRADTTAYLEERGFAVPAKTTAYSINKGLWGTTVGGRETHSPEEALPNSAYTMTKSVADAPEEGVTVTIGFEGGLPVSVDGVALTGVEIIETLNTIGAEHGVGRGVHVGDTILGIKGRVGFEAPAALTLIAAHRELEKVVLTKWQQHLKKHAAELYGMLLHEGQYFDPVMRDIEALFDASQESVSGSATVGFHKGSLQVQGCSSDFSMFNQSVATYGELNHMWTADDARGFAKIAKTQAALALKAKQQNAVH
ncbi:MAG: argininosuccinate synthase [Rhodothermales bacterium]